MLQLLKLLLQASSSSSTILVIPLLIIIFVIIIKILLWCWEIVKDWLRISKSKSLNTWSSDRLFESNSPSLSAVDQHKDNRPPACILCTCRWATCAGRPLQGTYQPTWSENWLKGKEKRDAHLSFPLVVTITSRFRPRLISSGYSHVSNKITPWSSLPKISFHCKYLHWCSLHHFSASDLALASP